MVQLKTCAVHGTELSLTEPSRNRFRCLTCKAEQARMQRKMLKQQAVDYLGGKCSACGYCKNLAALEFHHEDPAGKDFEISKKVHGSLEDIKEELDKCKLLCSNCHREVHNRELNEH